MAVDWLRIRNDYINGGGSYRELAKKYDVPFRTLSDRAIDEGWKKAKDKHRNKTVTKTEQKTIEKTSDALSDEAAMKVRIRGKLLWLAEKWINGILESGIDDVNDFRKMVQSCADLGVADEQGNIGGTETKEDGLSQSLRELAEGLESDD